MLSVTRALPRGVGRHTIALLIALAFAVNCLASAAQEPTGPIQVRRIEFQGVNGIDDEVLRRELVQLEAAVLNAVALEQSRARLERLPFIESAAINLRLVKDTADTVDVVITIEQAPARRYGGGGAWSESLRASLHGYFINENLFGTGQRLAIEADGSALRTIAQVSHIDPYALSAGVSRSLTLSTRRIDRLTADASRLSADLDSVVLEYAYRTGESQTLRVGAALRSSALTTGEQTSAQLVSWVSGNGNPRRLDGTFFTDFLELDWLLQWRLDTRDRGTFPSRGLEQTFTWRAAVPGSEVEYALLDYQLASYWPIGSRWTAMLATRLGFGTSYRSGTTSLPPYLNWFAGGPESVRGFRDNRLGPRDSLGNPFGGNLLVTGRFELMNPWPRRWSNWLRVGFFYDVGNVFSTEGITFLDDAGQRLDFGFDVSELRHSSGLAVHWLLPIGSVRLSYGVPLNSVHRNNRFLDDEVDRFQIAFGVKL